MDTKPATNYPKSAAARAKAAAAIPTAPASQPPAQKAEMGLWNQVKKDLPLSQAEKTAQAEQRKKEAEEQLRALAEEKACIGQYAQFAKDMVDPGVRSVFDRVVKETQGHYDLIESEYAHIMTMVHESDQDIYVRE